MFAPIDNENDLAAEWVVDDLPALDWQVEARCNDGAGHDDLAVLQRGAAGHRQGQGASALTAR